MRSSIIKSDRRNNLELLKSKLQEGNATIGIIGLGYVGLPLAVEFAKKFRVIGFDVDKNIISTLNSGRSHILDVPDKAIKEIINTSFVPVNEPGRLSECDFFIICVPTPLGVDKIPDLSYIISSCRTISSILRKGQFVILESTTYPGTTEEVVIPLLEESGLTSGTDFGVAYSPERIDPGNKDHPVGKIPKVVGGISHECGVIASTLYGSIIESVIIVSDTKTAESVKMVENIFRNVNIALANEMALIFERMGINSWEVIDAASTKPYGFMPFYPGPGIGGHCIPLDPYYMSYKAKRYGFIPRFIENSGEINEFMQMHVVNLIEEGLGRSGKTVRSSRISVFGLAYKKNINDTRESPSIPIIAELLRIGARLQIHDPYVSSININGNALRSIDSMHEALSDADCALFLTDHDLYKSPESVDMIKEINPQVVIDCKNIFSENVGRIYIGLGKANNK